MSKQMENLAKLVDKINNDKLTLVETQRIQGVLSRKLMSKKRKNKDHPWRKGE